MNPRIAESTLTGFAVVLSCLVLMAVGCSSSPAPAPTQPAAKSGATAQPAAKSAAPVVWKWATNTSENSAKGDMQKTWKKVIEEKTKGQVQVEIYWEGALGAEQKAHEAVLQKAVQMGLASNSNTAAIVPRWSALDMPFLITGGYDGLRKFMAGSPGLKELEADTEKKGLKVVAYLQEGFRHLFTTKKQVKVPADAKGLKLRTTPSALEAGYVAAFGSNPSVVDWGEIYLALKQGTVDGYNVAYSSVNNFKHTDALKYCLEYSIVPIVSVITMNLEHYNSLTPELRQAMVDAYTEGNKQVMEMSQRDDEVHKAALEKGGVTFYTPTAAELKQWQDLVGPVYEKNLNVAPVDWVDKVRTSLK